jgi:hypothetical protein
MPQQSSASSAHHPKVSTNLPNIHYNILHYCCVTRDSKEVGKKILRGLTLEDLGIGFYLTSPQ